MIEGSLGILSFGDRIADAQSASLTSDGIDILQVNLGYRCNMACRHCHVEAGPDREEMMDETTVGSVLDVLGENRIGTLDITGGAPEMNPHFIRLVEKAKQAGAHVVVRTNLTILLEDDRKHLPEFLGDQSVEIIASLPHYTEDEVDRMRGRGTFEKSVRVLRILNRLGYGTGREDRALNLVYNPAGAFLAPSQQALEEDYRRGLGRQSGITFDGLYTFNNTPVGRFRDFLLRSGSMKEYVGSLVSSFNPEAIPGLMCRHLISVGWDGRLYDCDFNQMLGLPLNADCPGNIREFDLSRIARRTITVGDHCYACTAGRGST
jgi:radical SAM/Cys-rich protein